MLKLSIENKIFDISDLNKFQIGDEVIADACATHDRFEGVIVGIELSRSHGSEVLQPDITLLHDGYLTDGFKPSDLRKVASPPSPQSTVDADDQLTRPIAGIENRTASEVFDIMADRIRLSLKAKSPSSDRAASEGWQPIETAPKDQDILVWFDHEADTYQCPITPGRLTDYAAWAESGDFMAGNGFCIAKWFPPLWETEDEYGSGYELPAWWFAKQFGDYEYPVNPIYWRPLPAPPEIAEAKGSGQ